LRQVFIGMDAPLIHFGHLQEKLQMRSNNFKKIEDQHITSPDTKGWRNPCFSHGIIPTRRNLHKEHLHINESELACHRDTCTCLLHHFVGKQVKKTYSLICDEFIAWVYFIIFKKEFTRLSVASKKMISN
jgi:hypothetical protein